MTGSGCLKLPVGHLLWTPLEMLPNDSASLPISTEILRTFLSYGFHQSAMVKANAWYPKIELNDPWYSPSGEVAKA